MLPKRMVGFTEAIGYDVTVQEMLDDEPLVSTRVRSLFDGRTMRGDNSRMCTFQATGHRPFRRAYLPAEWLLYHGRDTFAAFLFS